MADAHSQQSNAPLFNCDSDGAPWHHSNLCCQAVQLASVVLANKQVANTAQQRNVKPAANGKASETRLTDKTANSFMGKSSHHCCTVYITGGNSYSTSGLASS